MAELTPVKDQERAVTSINLPPPLRAKTKRPVNPYSLKRSKRVEIRITDFPSFIKMVNGHVNTILTHDPGQKSASWYSTWQQWIEDDLLEATTLHMISVVVEFPPTEIKTHKSVSRFILEQLNVLDRYLHVPFQTRDDDPLVKISAPVISKAAQIENAPSTPPSTTKPDNNSFAILEDLEEEAKSVATSLGPPISEIEPETELQSLGSTIEQIDETSPLKPVTPITNKEPVDVIQDV